MAAGHAQRVYDDACASGDVRRVAICDLRNRPRWHDLWEGNPILATPIDVARGEAVHRIQNASHCRPYLRYPFTTRTGWRWTDWKARDHVGRVYLTDQDRAAAHRVRAGGPYVFLEPRSKLGNRMWSMDRYAEVVRSCPGIRFVCAPDDPRERNVVPGVEVLTRLSFRQVMGLIEQADLYIGAEGGCQHAAAVLQRPAVVIFGGCISVDALGYPTHVNLSDDGPGSPCGSWRPCRHCRDAMEGITADTVVSSLGTVLTQERAA